MTSFSRAHARVFWADARFYIGLALVAASIAGVWWVIGAARQTAPVLAASQTIVPGQAVTAADLRVVDVALGQVGDAYLDPERLDDGLVATRTITDGELIPAGSVASAENTTTTSVVVRSAVAVPSRVTTGTTVEVWQAPLSAPGEYDTPRILITDATVAAVTTDEAMMGTDAASLELVIERADVADTLAAVASGAALSVVPTGTPG